jgi:hypothetical protein
VCLSAGIANSWRNFPASQAEKFGIEKKIKKIIKTLRSFNLKIFPLKGL